MRRACLLLGAIAVLLLSGCYEPYTPPYVDPYPYSFADSSKPEYPNTLYWAQRFIEDCRDHWRGESNVGVQYPRESYSRMRGDCDDWAVMIAFYLQEHFGADTLIIILKVDGVGHACPFVAEDSGVVSFDGCSGSVPIVTLTSTGEDYYPIETSRCPWWTWTHPGNPIGPPFEWSDLAGNSQLSELPVSGELR